MRSQNPYERIRTMSADPFYNLVVTCIYTGIKEVDKEFFKSEWGKCMCNFVQINPDHMLSACERVERGKNKKRWGCAI